MKRCAFALPMLIALASFQGVTLRADEPFTAKDQIANAALIYWQAFALLPELSEEDSELLLQLERGEKPLQESRALLGRCQSAFNMTKHVKTTTPCRWGLVEDGVATLLPHLAKARLLAKMMVLQARVDVAADNDVDAVQQFERALLLARNVDEGTLIQLLVGQAIEGHVVKAAEPLLTDLDQEALDRLAEALDAMPARVDFADAIRYERDVFGKWLKPLIENPADIRKQVQELGISPEEAALFFSLGISPQDRKQRFDEFIEQYDQIIASTKLPANQAAERLKELESATTKSANPLISTLMPAVSRAYGSYAEAQERFAAFEKAVDQARRSPGPLQ